MSIQTFTCGCRVHYDETPSDAGITGVNNTHTDYCDSHRPRPADQGSGDILINIQIIPQW